MSVLSKLHRYTYIVKDNLLVIVFYINHSEVKSSLSTPALLTYFIINGKASQIVPHPLIRHIMTPTEDDDVSRSTCYLKSYQQKMMTTADQPAISSLTN